MKILFSFCNTLKGSNYYQKNGLSQLAILDTDESKVYYLKIPRDMSDNGVTGIAKDEEYFYAITHAVNNPTLMRFYKSTLDLNKRKGLEKVKHPHSIVIDKDMLLVCSTGTNSIESYDKSSFEYLGTYWQHPNTNKKKDEVHLNSLFIHNGVVWGSCFGKKNGARWSTAKDGYLINTATNKKYFRIHHPHSGVSFDGKLYYCESTTGSIKVGAKLVKKDNRSYVRGLDVEEKHLVYGVSSARLVSKSMNEVNSSTERGEFIAQTGISVVDRKTGKKDYYDLLSLEKEIFDVLIINDEDATPKLKLSGIDNLQEIKNTSNSILVSSLIGDNDRLRKEVLEYKNKLLFATNKLNSIVDSKYFMFWKYYLKVKSLYISVCRKLNFLRKVN